LLITPVRQEWATIAGATSGKQAPSYLRYDEETIISCPPATTNNKISAFFLQEIAITQGEAVRCRSVVLAEPSDTDDRTCCWRGLRYY